jgi:predicted alpha/beta-hydrolase family hydrolase
MERRGHGRFQLQVLEFLYRRHDAHDRQFDPSPAATIVNIAGQGASRSRIESLQRAATSLADDGFLVRRELTYDLAKR